MRYAVCGTRFAACVRQLAERLLPFSLSPLLPLSLSPTLPLSFRPLYPHLYCLAYLVWFPVLSGKQLIGFGIVHKLLLRAIEFQLAPYPV